MSIKYTDEGIIATYKGIALEEVNTGKWVFTQFYDNYHTPIYHCTACLKEIPTHYINQFKRCPMCGAHMTEIVKE